LALPEAGEINFSVSASIRLQLIDGLICSLTKLLAPLSHFVNCITPAAQSTPALAFSVVRVFQDSITTGVKNDRPD
jgi:hypothetical protein